MLKQRILSTLKYFDLQNTPLTLLELHRFLLPETQNLLQSLDGQWELVGNKNNNNHNNETIGISKILQCLDGECAGEIECNHGFYSLKGRREIISRRLENYIFGIRREQLIKRFVSGVRHVPFVRGVGLVGSQPLGQQKKDSDIDLLILVELKFTWLARMLVTFYFQSLGRRRHGKKIANRFCLNHYVTADKVLAFDRNLYTAAEYCKLRPLVYLSNLSEFQNRNGGWIKYFFPQMEFAAKDKLEKISRLQQGLEFLLKGRFGLWLEKLCKKLQYGRLNIGEFIVASDEELSFHPNNRKKELFCGFFEYQKQNGGEAVELVETPKI